MVDRLPRNRPPLWLGAAPLAVLLGYFVMQGPKWCLARPDRVGRLRLLRARGRGRLDRLAHPRSLLLTPRRSGRCVEGRCGQRGYLIGRRWLVLWLAALGLSLYPLLVQGTVEHRCVRPVAAAGGDRQPRLAGALCAADRGRRRIRPRRAGVSSRRTEVGEGDPRPARGRSRDSAGRGRTSRTPRVCIAALVVSSRFTGRCQPTPAAAQHDAGRRRHRPADDPLARRHGRARRRARASMA